MNPTHRIRLALVWLCAASGLATAEQERPSASIDAQDDDAPSVYVDDSLEALSAIRKADRFAEAERWREAVQAYDHAVERFGDKLIRIGPRSYVGPVVYVKRRIAGWPDEALQVYRLLHGDEARRRLDLARDRRDRSMLLAVLDEHFCTEAGATAGDLAAQLAIEDGDLALAKRIYRDLIQLHPDRARHGGSWLTKLALCHAWDGRHDDARNVLERLRKEHAKLALTWQGRQTPAADVVDGALDLYAEPADAASDFVWPTLAGSVDRSRVPPGSTRPGAPLWEFGQEQGFDPDMDQPGSGRSASRLIRRDPFGRTRTSSAIPILAPVGDELNVYLCDGEQLWAVRSSDGAPVWRVAAESGNDFKRRSPPTTKAHVNLHAPSLHRGRIYAVLDQPAGPASRRGHAQQGLLVCLDARSGEMVFQRPLAQNDDLSTVLVDGGPLVYEDRVYLVGRRRKRFGFEDCYLLCYSADTGDVQWVRHLASASVSSFGSRRRSVTYPTASEGMVYVCTNIGAVAAIDADTGRLVWLRIYHRDRTEEEAGVRFARRADPWNYGAPLCWDEKLICDPLDNENVVVLDRGTGEVLRRIDTGSLGHHTQLLGVLDDTLFAAGRSLVAWDLVANEARWTFSLDAGQAQLGRGQLTRTHVYLPTREGLLRVPLSGGTVEPHPWPEDAVGGNVLVRDDVVVVAGSDRITGYAPKDEAYVRLRARIDAAPDDPMPLLDFAEVAFRVGDRDMAIELMDRAVDIGGGFARIVDPLVRARLFRDFLQFGDKALTGETADAELALKMYKQAAQCPPDADAHVEYRLRLAEALTLTHRFADAIEQYQQIIADAGLRRRMTIPPDPKETDPTPAGQWAEQQIDVLLKNHGREPYARFERTAQNMLQAGLEHRDLEAIERVIDAYPNALAARQALMVKADLLEQSGQHRRAVRALLQILNRNPRSEAAPQVVTRIAETLLRADRPHAAIRWLARGARMFPDHRFERNNKQIGFAQRRQSVVDRLLAEGARSGPAFSLPLSPSIKRTFHPRTDLLEPTETLSCESPTDLVVLYSEKWIFALGMPDNAPKWDPYPCKSKPSLLAVTPERLVFRTRHRLFALDRKTGRRAWERVASPASANTARIDPEHLRRWVHCAMTEDHIVGVLDDQRAMCFDVRTGHILWRIQLSGRIEQDPLISEAFYIYRAITSGSRKMQTHVLDVETGRTLGKMEAAGYNRPIWQALTDVGLLVEATSRRLSAVDPFTGEEVWKTDARLHNFRATITQGLDSLYLSHDGMTLVRRSLRTGKVLAESPPVANRQGDLHAIQRGDRIYVRSKEHITALDAETLAIVWRGTSDSHPNLIAHAVGPRYVVAVEGLSDPEAHRPGRRYIATFYDRRNDSGLIAGTEGRIDLGHYDQARDIHFADHALLVLDGGDLHGWVGAGK